MSAELAPEIDEVLTLAADAAPIFATTSADERATLLGAIATGLGVEPRSAPASCRGGNRVEHCSLNR